MAATIVILEVGDQAIPITDETFTDPVTELEYTMLSKDVPGIVRTRTQVGIDIETDTPLYNYQVTFSPALTTTITVPADPDDPTSVETQKTFTATNLNFTNEDLGLITGQEPIIDVTAIQQEVTSAQQTSQSALSTASAIDASIKQQVNAVESFGAAEISKAVNKMQRNDDDIQSRDVVGLSDEDLTRKAQENKISATLLGSDQQLWLEYVDNLFSFRGVLTELKESMFSDQAQSQAQVKQGLEDDQANADAFHDQFLSSEEANNVFSDPDSFDYPEDERDEVLTPKLSEIATLMNSSLLNPEDSIVPVVIEAPDRTTGEVDPIPDFEPIIPPGVDEEDL